MKYERNKIFKTKEELYSVWLEVFLILYSIKLPPKVKELLGFFILYGLNQKTYDDILEKKIVPTMQSISNAKTLLYDMGLMTKNPWRLVEGLDNIKIEDTLEFNIKCKIPKLVE